MAHLNKVLLLGNLTRDPELRATPKGNSVVQFGLAINRAFRGEDGESREETTFVDLEAWGRTAELIARYLNKGSACLVEGRLRLDSWEDKASGERRSRLRVVADGVQFIGRRATDPLGEADPLAELPGVNPTPPRTPAAPAHGPGAPRSARRGRGAEGQAAAR
jgi:single-strand DNA-binding protein